MITSQGVPRVPESIDRVVVMDRSSREVDVHSVVASLKKDCVVLVRSITADHADELMQAIAEKFGLSDNLELQAGFAEVDGHRHNIGKFFMSVNKRNDYQFISPHSEGSSFIAMQLASFFCYENSTDGGETILMNIDGSSQQWDSLREKVTRGIVGTKVLSPHEIVRARGLYQLDLTCDLLKSDDQILREFDSDIPGLRLADVLAKPQKTYSHILDGYFYALWDTTASIDFDLAVQYRDLLRQCELLREPAGGLETQQMDNAAERRAWHSGIDYAQLFKCKITCKLAPGDFLVLNNMTWAHSVSNWSPESGERRIAGSFA